MKLKKKKINMTSIVNPTIVKKQKNTISIDGY